MEPGCACLRTAPGVKTVFMRVARAGLTETLSIYLFRQAALPLGFFTAVLAGVVWLTQSLDMLDLVLNRGQSAGTFLYLTLLVFPSLLAVILPIALFCAVLYALHRLQGDSELTVLAAAGVSRWRLLTPVMALAFVAALLSLLLNLWLMPAGYRAMKDRIYAIRGELATALIQEGAFSTPVRGLTIFLADTNPGGELINIFVHDNRQRAAPVTYVAERGTLLKTEEGPRLLMVNGTIQRIDGERKSLQLLDFERYVFDLSQFATPQAAHRRELSERYLSELITPDPENRWEMEQAGQLIAEGVNRLASPLYNFAFALVAFVAVACAPYTRKGPSLRLVVAMVSVLLARLSGFGLQSLSAGVEGYYWLQFAAPCAVAGVCVFLIARPAGADWPQTYVEPLARRLRQVPWREPFARTPALLRAGQDRLRQAGWRLPWP